MLITRDFIPVPYLINVMIIIYTSYIIVPQCCNNTARNVEDRWTTVSMLPRVSPDLCYLTNHFTYLSGT